MLEGSFSVLWCLYCCCRLLGNNWKDYLAVKLKQAPQMLLVVLVLLLQHLQLLLLVQVLPVPMGNSAQTLHLLL